MGPNAFGSNRMDYVTYLLTDRSLVESKSSTSFMFSSNV